MTSEGWNNLLYERPMSSNFLNVIMPKKRGGWSLICTCAVHAIWENLWPPYDIGSWSRGKYDVRDYHAKIYHVQNHVGLLNWQRSINHYITASKSRSHSMEDIFVGPTFHFNLSFPRPKFYFMELALRSFSETIRVCWED